LGVHHTYRTQAGAVEAVRRILDVIAPRILPEYLQRPPNDHEVRVSSTNITVARSAASGLVSVLASVHWEARNYTVQHEVKSVVVDGETYTRESKEITYSEWFFLVAWNGRPITTTPCLCVIPHVITYSD